MNTIINVIHDELIYTWELIDADYTHSAKNVLWEEEKNRQTYLYKLACKSPNNTIIWSMNIVLILNKQKTRVYAAMREEEDAWYIFQNGGTSGNGHTDVFLPREFDHYLSTNMTIDKEKMFWIRGTKPSIEIPAIVFQEIMSYIEGSL